ncbi:MAG TPA: hypothetical protein VM432_10745 [Bdellovibrionales bacterium]|jgi:ElaB/YqjD/DUF883 family membrane-anchored ribosome-binding protein|nr:hypothetical protein [Bdellovibrionales bacterium]
MARSNKPKTMSDAIDALDEAMNSQAAPDLNATVSAGFDDLKSAFRENTQAGAEYASRMIDSAKRELSDNFDEVSKRAKIAADDVDRSVRANPWPFIGGAAVGMLALGFLIGRRD